MKFMLGLGLRTVYLHVHEFILKSHGKCICHAYDPLYQMSLVKNCFLCIPKSNLLLSNIIDQLRVSIL